MGTVDFYIHYAGKPELGFKVSCTEPVLLALLRDLRAYAKNGLPKGGKYACELAHQGKRELVLNFSHIQLIILPQGSFEDWEDESTELASNA